MNILIINCSPVRNGATAEIVNLVKEHVEEGNVVKSLRKESKVVQTKKQY